MTARLESNQYLPLTFEVARGLTLLNVSIFRCTEAKRPLSFWYPRSDSNRQPLRSKRNISTSWTTRARLTFGWVPWNRTKANSFRDCSTTTIRVPNELNFWSAKRESNPRGLIGSQGCYRNTSSAWLGNLESNQDKRLQRPPYYHYTIPHQNLEQMTGIKPVTSSLARTRSIS